MKKQPTLISVGIAIVLIVGIGVFAMFMALGGEQGTLNTTNTVANSVQNSNIVTISNDSQITDTSTETPEEDVKILTYRSERLGVEFEYPDFPENFKEVDGKIFLLIKEGYDGLTESYEHFLLEVFTKNKNTPIKEALNETILGGYSNADCVMDTGVITFGPKTIDDFPSSYELLGAVVPADQKIRENLEETYQLFQVEKKCPATYGYNNGPAYFIYDKNVPDKYVFVPIGNGGSVEVGKDLEWQETIRFLK
jgi:hypothetical protein